MANHGEINAEVASSGLSCGLTDHLSALKVQSACCAQVLNILAMINVAVT